MDMLTNTALSSFLYILPFFFENEYRQKIGAYHFIFHQAFIHDPFSITPSSFFVNYKNLIKDHYDVDNYKTSQGIRSERYRISSFRTLPETSFPKRKIGGPIPEFFRKKYNFFLTAAIARTNRFT
ncbi:hypothetical protein DLM75_18535 [Leptospira stimsonii]|uniref:Uncharacterized protein n=1 Tax=Leptospira stimsonii TaxID=2202203 RepID=A0A396Z0C5_9LEPT|nr:hypothetical protein DLM75_18535 [Leptospira stimsonii]